MNNINKANKENKCQIIKNYDLLYNKYDVNILEQNIDHLNKRFLICTQNLTAEFCVKYILNLNIELGSEDSYIYDINYILERQPHITEEDLYKAFAMYYKR